MPSESELMRLIGLSYDAAESPSRWMDFLQNYASAFSAHATFFQLHDMVGRSSEMTTVFGLSPRFKASYNMHYGRLNVWRERCPRLYVQGRAVLDGELCPRQVLVRTEFYNDYLVPMEGEYSAGGVIRRDVNEAFTVGAMRDRQHGPFDQSEGKAIEILLPHLTRAHAIAMRLQLLQAGESALDRLDVGIAFLTTTGDLVHCNQAAAQAFEQNDGLRIQGRRVHANGLADDARLRNALREASAATVPMKAQSALIVSRPSGRRPYQVLVAPFRHGLPILAGMRAAAVTVLIVDPTNRRASAPELLMRLYGLTRREATFTAELSTGRTVEESAQSLRMTYETARSHLRRIFDKTGTSRQAELILLIARLPKGTG